MMKYEVWIGIFIILGIGAYMMIAPPAKDVLSLEQKVANIAINKENKESAKYAKKIVSKLQQKLNNIVLKNIDFKEKNLSDAIDRLRIAAKKADTEKEGINIVLLFDKNETSENTNPPKAFTIKMNDLNLLDAIKVFCQVFHLNFKIDKNAVIIFNKNKFIEKMETRCYFISNDISSTFEEYDKDGRTFSVKGFFIDKGIKFPNNAKITLNNSSNCLIARNTPAELNKISMIFKELDSRDPQINILAQTVKMDECEYRKIKKEQKINGSSLGELIMYSTKAEILSRTSIISQNGEEASFRNIREEFFPECYREGFSTEIENNNSKLKGEKNIDKKEKKLSFSEVSYKGITYTLSSMPEFGESTSLGQSFSICPNANLKNNIIRIDIVKNSQKHVGWTKYSNLIKMPIITNEDGFFSRSVKLKDGETIIILSKLKYIYNKSLKKEIKTRFLHLLTVQKIHSDGTPFKNLNINANLNENDLYAPLKVLNKTEKTLNNIKIKNFKYIKVDFRKVLKDVSIKLKTINKNINISLKLNENPPKNIPTISLDLNNISILEMMKYLKLQSNLYCKISNNDIIFSNYKNEEMIEMPISPSNLFRDSDISSNDQKNIYKKLINYLKERGLTFSEKSSLRYNKINKKYYFKDTKANIALFQEFLNLNPEKNVNIEFTTVEIYQKDLIDLIGKKASIKSLLTQEEIQKILNTPKGKILNSSNFITLSGEETNNYGGTLKFFPETYTEPQILIKDGTLYYTPSSPEFKATPLGISTSITPTYLGNQIRVSIHTQSLLFSSWSKYNLSLIKNINGKKTKKTDIIKMPIIRKRELSSKIIVRDGTTLMIGRSQIPEFATNPENSTKEQKNIFLFLKVDLN